MWTSSPLAETPDTQRASTEEQQLLTAAPASESLTYTTKYGNIFSA